MRIGKSFVLPFLAIFVFVALFGMYAMFAHAEHQSGCPFMPSAIACATSLTGHLDHWQIAFATIIELIVFAAFLFSRRFLFVAESVPIRHHLDFRSRYRVRPTLYQELYARGILNRKEP
ncbi:MAG: hypothetical protein WAZ27_05025 [Minisyncoccia bacterium]